MEHEAQNGEQAGSAEVRILPCQRPDASRYTLLRGRWHLVVWLEAGGRLPSIPPGEGLVALLLCLHGEVDTPIGSLRSRGLALVSELSACRALRDDTLVSVLVWPIQAGVNAHLISSESRPFRWYDKYKAQVAPLSGSDGRLADKLRPWSAYEVHLPPAEGAIPLHVHHRLCNLLFILGNPAQVSGHLLVRDERGVSAYPLLGGDTVFVPPGIVHNLAALLPANPLSFYVFNDEESQYEVVDSSDYHVQESIPRQAIHFRERPAGGELTLAAPLDRCG